MKKQHILGVFIIIFGIAIGANQDASARSTVIKTNNPDTSEFDEGFSVSGVCDFPITVKSHGDIAEKMRFADVDGVPQLVFWEFVHTNFYNRYEANGNALESLKASYTLQLYFDGVDQDGFPIFVDFKTVGNGGRTPLPDGTIFNSAGIISFKFFPSEGFGIPDNGLPFYFLIPGAGAAGDVGAFCDALSE